jgi:hypothetical protein
VPVWWVLRYLLTVLPNQHQRAGLVPTEVGPGAWTVLVVAAVTAYGVVVGRRAAARRSEVLAGARGLQPPPRPWAALLLVAAALLLGGYGAFYGRSDLLDLLAPLVGVLCAVVGMAGLAPWVAYRSARMLSGRVRTGAGLLATGRLSAVPRPAGRAAAAVGAVALTGGVLGAFVHDVFSQQYVDAPEIVPPVIAVSGCAVAAVLVIAVSLAVHSTETLLERRRELAALVATGVPATVVSTSQRIECLIATLPITVAGALVGGLGYGVLDSLDSGAAGVPMMVASVLLATAVTTGVVVLAVWATTRLLRPWALEAVDPGQLRTE